MAPLVKAIHARRTHSTTSAHTFSCKTSPTCAARVDPYQSKSTGAAAAAASALLGRGCCHNLSDSPLLQDAAHHTGQRTRSSRACVVCTHRGQQCQPRSAPLPLALHGRGCCHIFRWLTRGDIATRRRAELSSVSQELSSVGRKIVCKQILFEWLTHRR